MAGNQNAFDMQIKLLMIGDSGTAISYLIFCEIILFLALKALGKHAYFCVTLMIPFHRPLSQQLALTLR